ncbi:histidine--tRNA ligase [Thermus thermamylovorans]|uniref:Histidine--tRNA ligase n=1 Tax=Thermus thermamylovorans TaxID=2509362 RepID=A0A4Q9B7G7_9DEIN|nr:histidine--tRNA ligase [Thermus thermamylovorans]TBH21062.1 histidine--tRNA ligase [Thermus thermamylovorans]
MAVRGAKDLFGEELRLHQHIVATARRVLEGAGALELLTPIFEETQVFERGVGASTDIVRKEMFTFQDRGGRSLTLRPEGTAAMVRAYLEHGMKVWPQPVRLWMAGPMFRAERPQKGRYRQFHQVNYEALGSENPLLDAEAIALLYRSLRELGLKRLSLKLSSVGDPEDRARYNAYLRATLSPHREAFSEDSQERLEVNPLRILDSKSEKDQALLKELGVRPMLDFLGEAARAHLRAVERHLERLSIPYELEPSLVRGLDYYVRTAFEVHHPEIGAQSALGGGGRYDGLSELLGGPRVPGVGFAFGVERVALALEAEGFALPEAGGPDLYLVPLAEEAVAEAFYLAEALRPRLRVEYALGPKRPGKGVEEALKRGASFVGLLGEEELRAGEVTLKRLATGEQVRLSRAKALGFLLSALGRESVKL